MHKDTKLQLNELEKKNDIYQAFKKYAEKADKQVLYSAEPTLVYGDEQPAPYEGNLNVKKDKGCRYNRSRRYIKRSICNADRRRSIR